MKQPFMLAVCKTFLIGISLILSISSLASASYFELTGGYSSLAMTEYNKGVDETAASYSGTTAKVYLNKITGALNLTLLAAIVFDTNVGPWGLTFLMDYLPINNNNKVTYSNGTTFLESVEQLGVVYLGIGTRKYFAESSYFIGANPFIGVDLGAGFGVGDSAMATVYDWDGLKLDSVNVSLGGAMFGARIEIGSEWWISENFGFTIKAGGRYMKGVLKGESANADFVWKNGESVEQEVDYSGIFINIGLLGGLNAGKERVNQDVENDTIDDEEDKALAELEYNVAEFKELRYKGNVEFENERYEIAASYFERALQIQEDGYLFKKLGSCYYNLGNKKKAIDCYEKSLEMNPDDESVKDFIKVLKSKGK